jgi:fibronectin-binding autotransporter adhesin
MGESVTAEARSARRTAAAAMAALGLMAALLAWPEQAAAQCTGTTCTVTSSTDLQNTVSTINANPGTSYTVNITGGTIPLGTTSINTNGTVTVNSGTLSGSGTLTTGGAGTLTLNNSNTFSGGTTINAGTLTVGGSGSTPLGTGSVTLNGGTLTNAQTGAFNTTNTIIVGSGGGTLINNASGNQVGINGNIGGSGALTVTDNGNGIFVNNNAGGTGSFTGLVTVTNGAFVVNRAGQTPLAGAVTIGPNGNVGLGQDGQIASNVTVTVNGTLTFFSNTGTSTAQPIAQTIGTLMGASSGAITNQETPLATLTVGAGSFAGVIGVSGSNTNNNIALVKTGVGTLILNGASTYTGGTTVSGGTLEVGDASHTSASIAGAVTVNSGGTLAGHGRVGGAVTNTGTVSPGGSIGTLTVGGNYTQSSSGTLSIEVSPSASSKLAVTGSASLAGTLALAYDSGSYGFGTKYQILTAGNGVSGTFAATTASNHPLGFGQTVTVLPNEVDVTVVSNGFGSLASVMDLQQSVLGNTRFANATLAQHLDQAGQGVDGMFTATANLVPTQVAFAGGAEALSGMLAQLPDQLAMNGGWFRATGTFANVSSQGNAAGFHSSGGGFLAGFDRQIAPDLVAGVAAGYSRTDADIHDDGGSTATIDTPRAFVYGRYLLPTAYIDGSLGYAFDRFDMTRPVVNTGTTATSSHDGNEVSLSIQGGRPVALGWATLTPKAGFQYLHLSEDGYTETGAGVNNLTVSSHDADSFRPMIGATLNRLLITDGGTRIVPEARASYSHELLNVQHRVTEQDASSAPTSVTGLNPGRNIVGLGTGVAVAATNSLALFADYDASLSPGNATVQTVSAGLRWRF